MRAPESAIAGAGWPAGATLTRSFGAGFKGCGERREGSSVCEPGTWSAHAQDMASAAPQPSADTRQRVLFIVSIFVHPCYLEFLYGAAPDKSIYSIVFTGQ
jgi:hypothetical protein